MNVLFTSIRFYGSAAILFITCTTPLQKIPYEPDILFYGCFDYNKTGACTPETLPGYPAYPNRCYYSGDTTYLYFYSSDYSPTSSGCLGKMVRFQVYKTDSTYITTRCAVFHMSDCATGRTGMTYEVSPSDTINHDIFLRMKIERFSRVIGAPVSLSEIAVTPRTLGPGSMPLTITKGAITGKMDGKTP
jgi:hypothetical protein